MANRRQAAQAMRRTAQMSMRRKGKIDQINDFNVGYQGGGASAQRAAKALKARRA